MYGVNANRIEFQCIIMRELEDTNIPYVEFCKDLYTSGIHTCIKDLVLYAISDCKLQKGYLNETVIQGVADYVGLLEKVLFTFEQLFHFVKIFYKIWKHGILIKDEKLSRLAFVIFKNTLDRCNGITTKKTNYTKLRLIINWISGLVSKEEILTEEFIKELDNFFDLSYVQYVAKSSIIPEEEKFKLILKREVVEDWQKDKLREEMKKDAIDIFRVLKKDEPLVLNPENSISAIEQNYNRMIKYTAKQILEFAAPFELGNQYKNYVVLKALFSKHDLIESLFALKNLIEKSPIEVGWFSELLHLEGNYNSTNDLEPETTQINNNGEDKNGNKEDIVNEKPIPSFSTSFRTILTHHNRELMTVLKRAFYYKGYKILLGLVDFTFDSKTSLEFLNAPEMFDARILNIRTTLSNEFNKTSSIYSSEDFAQLLNFYIRIIEKSILLKEEPFDFTNHPISTVDPFKYLKKKPNTRGINVDKKEIILENPSSGHAYTAHDIDMIKIIIQNDKRYVSYMISNNLAEDFIEFLSKHLTKDGLLDVYSLQNINHQIFPKEPNNEGVKQYERNFPVMFNDPVYISPYNRNKTYPVSDLESTIHSLEAQIYSKILHFALV